MARARLLLAAVAALAALAALAAGVLLARRASGGGGERALLAAMQGGPSGAQRHNAELLAGASPHAAALLSTAARSERCYSRRWHFEAPFDGDWADQPSPPPAYFNLSCPFLQSTQSCSYLGGGEAARLASLRFRPRHCALPPPGDAAALGGMLDALAGRTLLFWGDSLSLQHYTSLACLLHGALPGALKAAHHTWRAGECTNLHCVPKVCALW